MKIKLNKYWIKYLLNAPESGMGYQRVNIMFRNGNIIKNVIVFNSEDLEFPDSSIKINSKDIVEIKLSKESVLVK